MHTKTTNPKPCNSQPPNPFCRNHTGELHGIVKSLLGRSTREDMLAWLGNSLNGNRERAKMREDVSVGWVVAVG